MSNLFHHIESIPSVSRELSEYDFLLLEKIIVNFKIIVIERSVEERIKIIQDENHKYTIELNSSQYGRENITVEDFICFFDSHF